MSVRLLALVAEIVAAVADPDAFTALTGAHLGTVGGNVREIAAQDAAHRARIGGTPEWGSFLAIEDAQQRVVGAGGYVAAPDAQGCVEIGYGTFPPYEGQGYGTAIAGALLVRAAASGMVRLVCAHTLPEMNASSRILLRHGFIRAGTAHDEDAGLVWRWERPVELPGK